MDVTQPELRRSTSQEQFSDSDNGITSAPAAMSSVNPYLLDAHSLAKFQALKIADDNSTSDPLNYPMSTYTGELDCYMPENNSERGTSGLGTAVCNPGTKPDSCRPEGHEARTTERAAAAWRAVVIRKHKLRKANRVNKRLVLATSDEGESNGVRKKKTRRNPRPNKRERMARAAQKNAQEDTPMLGIDTGYVAQDRVGAEGTKAASPSSCIPLSHTRRKSSTKDDDLINTLRQKLHDHEAFLRQLKEAQIQGSISLNDPCFMARKVRAAERLYVTMQVRLGREERTMSTKRRRCCRWP